jgi:glycosyltransferase involved in cell wall biosynthesis
MTKRNGPLVSLATPVYNGADHLAECIESVLSQTYKHWQLVIVNNCSTDSSGEIARRYAAKDRRLRVCENASFLSILENHNAALRQISPDSKYCKLVFADDLILPECLERMVAVAEDHPAAGIVTAYRLKGDTVTGAGLPHPTTHFSGREIGRHYFLSNLEVFGSATTVLYRSDIVRSRDPFYNPVNIHADTEVCIDILRESDLAFVHQILTVTRLSSRSQRARMENLRSYLGGSLRILVNHGRAYLTKAEFEACLEQLLSKYYEVLARELVYRRDREFWDYHRRSLVESGVGFEQSRLIRAIFKALCSALLNPKHTVQTVRRQYDLWRDSQPDRGAGDMPDVRVVKRVGNGI